MTHLIARGAERIREVHRTITRTVGAAVLLLGAAAMASGDDGSIDLHPLVRPDGGQVVLTIDGIDYAAFSGDENLTLVADGAATVTVPLRELLEVWGVIYDAGLEPIIRKDGSGRQVVFTMDDGREHAVFRDAENLILVADDGVRITVPPDAVIPGITATMAEWMETWGTAPDDLIPGSVDHAMGVLREQAERDVDPGGSADDVPRG